MIVSHRAGDFASWARRNDTLKGHGVNWHPISFTHETTMKISARLATLMCVVFAAVCISVSLHTFNSLGDVVDPVILSDGKGFAWFWMFLAAVAVVFGVLSWWIARTEGENE
jgi:ABC-type enterochelin transport system permease subunit